MVDSIYLIIAGVAGGSAVGSSIIAFITVLGVIPRIIQVSKTRKYLNYFQYVVVSGAVFSTLSLFFDIGLGLGNIMIIIVGIFMGVFVGMLAAALTEVINVIPIFTRRFRITQYIVYILILVALGKTIGSAIYWWYPLIWN